MAEFLVRYNDSSAPDRWYSACENAIYVYAYDNSARKNKWVRIKPGDEVYGTSGWDVLNCAVAFPTYSATLDMDSQDAGSEFIIGVRTDASSAYTNHTLTQTASQKNISITPTNQWIEFFIQKSNTEPFPLKIIFLKKSRSIIF